MSTRAVQPIAALALTLAVALLAVLVVSFEAANAAGNCLREPRGLQLEMEVVDGAFNVVMNWSHPTQCKPNNYAIFRRDVNDGEEVESTTLGTVVYEQGNPASRTFTDVDVPPGITYLYGVSSNGRGTPKTDEITVQSDPVFDDNLPTTISVDEHTARGADIGDPYSATDIDGDSLRYHLSGTDETRFTIGPSTGQLRTEYRFDYETRQTTFYATVGVRDSTDDTVDDATIDVTINVTDADDAGTVTITGALSVDSELTASLNDVDGTPTSVTWQWARASSDAGPFTDIMGETDVSYTLVAADSGDYLQVTASYTDAQFGAGKTASAVTSSSIGATNSGPMFRQGRVNRVVDENSPAGTSVGNPVTATDTEMDPLTYSLSGTDADAFEIDSDGQIKTVSDVIYDFEATKNTYAVIVEVHDNKDLYGNPDPTIDDRVTVNITLRNADEPGMATIFQYPRRRIIFGSSLTDPDVLISVTDRSWYVGDTADPEGVWTRVTDADGNPSNYEAVAADVGKYIKVRVRYTDQEAPNTTKEAEAVTGSPIPAGNSDPAFKEGSPTTRTVPENSPAGASVGAALTATETDADPLIYSLSGTYAGSFEIDSAGQITTMSGVTYNFESSQNSYSVTVGVSDELDLAAAPDTEIDATIDVTISLTNVNEPPTIHSGPTAESVLENTTVVATYMASDVDALDTLTWSVDTANDGGFFEIAESSGELSFKSAPDFETKEDQDTDNVYDVTVRVTDSGDMSATRDVAVTVTTANEAPAIDAGPDDGATINRDENTATTEVLATYQASDPDVSDTLTWSLQGADSGDFTVTKNTAGHGDLTFSNSPNYEMPADSDTDNDYEVIVKVSDGSLDVMRSLTVQVEDANDAPRITSGPSAKSILENSTDALGTYVASDEDTSDTQMWSVETTDDGRFFQIDALSGDLSFKVAPDFETKEDSDGDSVYHVTIRVTDNGAPEGSSTRDVAVTVTNVNEAPTIDAGPANGATINRDEGTATTDVLATFGASDPDEPTTFRWTLAGDDGARFTITEKSGSNREAELRFNASPDFEMPADHDKNNEYRVTVRATDNGSPTALFDEHSYVVAVSNVNEAGTVTISGDLSGGEQLSAAVTDLDGAPTDVTWQWAREDSTSFTDIGGATSANYTTVAADVDKFLQATASYHDPESDTTLKTASGVSSGTVEASNSAPTFGEGDDTTRTVPENSEVGTPVGAAVTASDSDSDTLVYTLGGTDADFFEIDSTSGQIKTGTGTYDFEAVPPMKNTYEVTVSVHDGKDAASYAETTPTIDTTITVSIELTNVNEAPVITTDRTDFTAFNVDENTDTTEVIQTYEASDVDDDSTLTWSLEGDDVGDFTLTKNAAGHGELKFDSVPNYEMPADTIPTGQTEGDNVYDIIVKVTDNGIPDNRDASNQRDDTLSVAVTVEDANDQPMVSGDDSPDFPEIEFDVVGADLTTEDLMVPGTYTFTDEDKDDVTWSLSGADGHHFIITADADGNGVLTFKNPTPDSDPPLKPADYENPADVGSGNDYEVTVEATDNNPLGALTGTFTVTVAVTPVNETPEVTAGGAAHSFPEIAYDVLDADLTAMDYVVSTYSARDEEEETEAISWDLAGEDMADFAIDSSGVLSFRNRPNYEDPTDAGETVKDNIYEVTVQAKDTASNTRDYPVTVEVTDVDETPEVTGPADNPDYPETPYDSDKLPPDVATFTARDEEMQDITWSLGGADAGLFVITKDDTDGSGVVTFTTVDLLEFKRPDFERPEDVDDDGAYEGDGTYEFTVEAFDDTNTGTWDYTVTVTGVNERPWFTGTVDNTIIVDEHDANELYETPILASYTGDDEEGGVTWSLAGTDSGDFNIGEESGVVTFAAAPSFETPADADGDNVYEFMVRVSDVESTNTRLTAEESVTVTVEDVEEAGTIAVAIQRALGEQFIDDLNPAVGETIRFTVSDPDGGIDLSSPFNQWSIQSRSAGGAWSDINVSASSSEITTYSPDEDDTLHEIRAIISYADRRGDGKNAEGEATAPVTADPIINAPPRLSSGGTQLIPEVDAGVDVGERLTATDRENDTVTWGIIDGPAADFFEIDPSSGQLRTTQAVDYETGDRSPFFVAQVTLSDGRGEDGVADSAVDVTTAVAFRIIDVEEEGVVTLSNKEPPVGELVTTTFDDGDGNISGAIWQWARSENGRTGWTNISGATSSSYTVVQSDADSFLRAQVTYADNRGGGKSAEAVTANRVFGENQRPTFPSAEDGRRSVAENTRPGVNIGEPVAAVDPEGATLVYSLNGGDAAAFRVVAGTGQIRTSEALDFETKSSYSFMIEVHDREDGSGNPSSIVDDSREVTITVENVEEPGEVTLTTDTRSIQARVPVTASLEDDDGDITGKDWQWSRSPNGKTGWVNILGATFAEYTPTLEEDAGNYIRATASYSDGHEPTGPTKTANAVSPRIGDPPPVNSAPAFPATENGQREAPEDAEAGGPIGDPVVANDLNTDDLTVNDPLAYSLAGTDAGSFTIHADTGQISLAQNVTLDYEGKRTYRFTVRVTDGRDQHGDDDMDAIDDTINVVVTVTDVNEAPVVTGASSPRIAENESTPVATYTGADPERDTLAWSVNEERFWISRRGELYFATPPSFEDATTTYQVTVTASDDEGLSDSLTVTVRVTDVEEEGTIAITPPRGWADVPTEFTATLTDDDGNPRSITWRWARSTNRSSWTDIPRATSSSYTAGADDVGNYLRATAAYTDRLSRNKTASTVLTKTIGEVKPETNEPPAFTEPMTTRTIGQGPRAGRSVGPPLKPADPDDGDVLTHSLSGEDDDAFEIDPATGQLQTKAVLDPEMKRIYTVTVSVHDGFNATYDPSSAVDDTADVTITVTEAGPSIFGGGGGGGGGPSGPSPSEIDFEWNVTRDIEELDSGHDEPTGMWSDATTLWLAHSGDGADDAVYAYDLESGERVPDKEFELDETNRAPRGVWSDGETAFWISDSGQDKLFAHDLAGGERLHERDLVLHPDNDDARGIWSDEETMWVLDDRDDALFAYDLASGELLAEYALASTNGDPRGIWSGGVSIWVSDHNAERLFAYRLPTLPDDEDASDEADRELERVRDEDFTELSSAGNNSPRGIWSDGAVMYVADAGDARVYSYNMPDAIDARLASLTLSGVDIGEFGSGTPEYEGVVDEGVTETTVAAVAVQSGAKVAIDPPDADGLETNGHQVALGGVEAITIAVTSRDGSRAEAYHVLLGDRAPEGPVADCLRGAVSEGFSLVVYEGGSVEDLVTCAESRHVTTLYVLRDGVYLSYILGAPGFVNAAFVARFADGVPSLTPLVVKSEGPPSTDPAGIAEVTEAWPDCLRGDVATGFSLVLFEGGSVEVLDSCAESLGASALYTLDSGEWVSYILGAPSFVNEQFRALFPDGLAAGAPLLVKRDGPS